MPSDKRDFTSARALLPSLLAKLSRQSGRAAGIRILWEEVAGPGISAAVTASRVEGDALVVIAPDRSWMQRLEEHAQELAARLSDRTEGQIKVLRTELQK